MKSKVIPAMLLSSTMVSSAVLAEHSNKVIGQKVRFHYEQVENVNMFYREVGNKDLPTILLLHGYAASSFMWRDVIDALLPRAAMALHAIVRKGVEERRDRGAYSVPLTLKS